MPPSSLVCCDRPVTLPPGRAILATRYWDDRCGLPCCDDGLRHRRNNDINFEPDELGRYLGEAFGAPFRPPIFDRNGPPLNLTEFTQPLYERSNPFAVGFSGASNKKANGWQLRRLLRPRCKWQARRRASDQRDEEADLKNFFGSLNHDWVLRFVEHRVGDPRLISLIRRWLKAGVLEDGTVHPSEQGTPQGGSISVLLSNVYLHYVLDLWFERVVKVRLRGEAHLVRYIDDFVICFQYRSDAIRVQDALRLRLGKFGLTLEPTKTKLVEFGRFAQRHAGKRGRNRPETIYFLGLTLYCTRNRKGNFKVGMRTEKSRLRRSLTSLQELMQRIRHQTISEQVGEINAVLRGHYAYYGVAGNLRSLVKVYRVVERYWRKMLCSRSWAGRRLTWDAFHQIKERTPLLKPKLRLPYGKLQVLSSAVNQLPKSVVR